MVDAAEQPGLVSRLAGWLTFERLVCLYAAGIPWMPFLNAGSAPVNTAYLVCMALWALLLLRRGASLSVPLTPGLVMGCVVFVWVAGGAVLAGALKGALVDLLHLGNFLLGYALIVTAVRTRDLVRRVLRAMLVSSFCVAGVGVGLSFLVNALNMRFLPEFMVNVMGAFL